MAPPGANLAVLKRENQAKWVSGKPLSFKVGKGLLLCGRRSPVGRLEKLNFYRIYFAQSANPAPGYFFDERWVSGHVRVNLCSSRLTFCEFFTLKMSFTMNQKEERTRYSEEELKEFEVLITGKLEATRNELKYIRETLSKKNDSGTDNTSGNAKLLEDGADTSERENNSQLAARLQKYATQLENALVRIKNGTYGVCVDTGKLIPKERLRLVPHTQQTIEAKLRRQA
jgi:RNA polymerase-binding transcription factor DksA